MIEKAKAQDRHEQAKEPSVPEGIRSELKSVGMGPMVNEDLAGIVNDLIQKGLSHEKLQEKLSKYPSAENCEALCKVKVNQLIGEGEGAIINGTTTGGRWTSLESQEHINIVELRATGPILRDFQYCTLDLKKY